MKTVLKALLWALIAATVGLVGWAILTNGSDAAISVILYWGYGLLALAIVGVLCAALIDTITHPSGLKKTLIAVVAVAAVVGTVLGLVLSHEPVAVANSAGGSFTDAFELRISEMGIYVTYVVAVLAVAVVAYDLVSGLVRKVLK